MKTILIFILCMLSGCTEPRECIYQHTDPDIIAGRMWVPARDVYLCDDNVWVYGEL